MIKFSNEKDDSTLHHILPDTGLERVLWVLACGTQTCTQPTSSGTVVFGPSDPYEGDFAALTPGNYVMHLLRGTGSYPSYAASDPFIIVAGAPVTAPVAAPAVAPI